MKKLLLTVALLALTCLPAAAQSATNTSGQMRNHPISKLFRGFINVATCPFEMPRQIQKNWIKGSEQASFPAPWILSGIIEGMIETTKRCGSGVWDVLSFPVSVPQGYGSLKHPEYVFEDWPQRNTPMNPPPVKVDVQ